MGANTPMLLTYLDSDCKLLRSASAPSFLAKTLNTQIPFGTERNYGSLLRFFRTLERRVKQSGMNGCAYQAGQ